MKINLAYVFAFIFLISVGSCRKTDNVLFEMDIRFDIDIPAGLNTIEDHFFVINDIPTFIDSYLSANNITAEDIGRITAAIGTFETRVSGLDLDIINDIGLQVLEPEDHTRRKELLYTFQDFVPFGTKTELEMIPSIIDVKEYFLKENVDLELKLDFRGFTGQTLDGRFKLILQAYPPE